ncbi:hypothetical protein AB4Y40_16185 [Paraburkholderia sp. EG287B]|uniref:hypothetical protein n=1 Tax=Paraburkholderia sp. EG287B TaxID=3237010 RepID=UPI0034D36110
MDALHYRAVQVRMTASQQAIMSGWLDAFSVEREKAHTLQTASFKSAKNAVGAAGHQQKEAGRTRNVAGRTGASLQVRTSQIHCGTCRKTPPIGWIIKASRWQEASREIRMRTSRA